jgi:lipopolysaccharide biosynthesis protein
MKIAIITHLFYIDLASEFREYFQNIPFKFDLFITTTKGSKEKLYKVFSKGTNNLNKLEIIEVPNYGFDIGPFLVEFKKHYPNYDYICKVHGKKSLQSLSLSYWRIYLLNNLLGSEKIIREIINILENNKNIGILYPPNYYVVEESNRRDPWRRNWKNCKILAERMKVDLDKNKDAEFPTGSMFWFRPGALKPLFSLDLKYSDFGKENRSDGTLAHAIERLFVVSVRRVGFREKKVLFESKFNKDISSNSKLRYLFCKLIMLVKKGVIYKLPYFWQTQFFKLFNKKQ